MIRNGPTTAWFWHTFLDEANADVGAWALIEPIDDSEEPAGGCEGEQPRRQGSRARTPNVLNSRWAGPAQLFWFFQRQLSFPRAYNGNKTSQPNQPSARTTSCLLLIHEDHTRVLKKNLGRSAVSPRPPRSQDFLAPATTTAATTKSSLPAEERMYIQHAAKPSTLAAGPRQPSSSPAPAEDQWKARDITGWRGARLGSPSDGGGLAQQSVQ